MSRAALLWFSGKGGTKKPYAYHSINQAKPGGDQITHAQSDPKTR
jgi:hypothetical protein